MSEHERLAIRLRAMADTMPKTTDDEVYDAADLRSAARLVLEVSRASEKERALWDMYYRSEESLGGLHPVSRDIATTLEGAYGRVLSRWKPPTPDGPEPPSPSTGGAT